MPKPKGKCPFCAKEMKPVVLDKNYIRRDRCICSECRHTIYVCRRAGCTNYAKGALYYDDELCPECTILMVKTVERLAIGIAGTVMSSFINKKLKK